MAKTKEGKKNRKPKKETDMQEEMKRYEAKSSLPEKLDYESEEEENNKKEKEDDIKMIPKKNALITKTYYLDVPIEKASARMYVMAIFVSYHYLSLSAAIFALDLLVWPLMMMNVMYGAKQDGNYVAVSFVVFLMWSLENGLLVLFVAAVRKLLKTTKELAYYRVYFYPTKQFTKGPITGTEVETRGSSHYHTKSMIEVTYQVMEVRAMACTSIFGAHTVLYETPKKNVTIGVDQFVHHAVTANTTQNYDSQIRKFMSGMHRNPLFNDDATTLVRDEILNNTITLYKAYLNCLDTYDKVTVSFDMRRVAVEPSVNTFLFGATMLLMVTLWAIGSWIRITLSSVSFMLSSPYVFMGWLMKTVEYEEAKRLKMFQYSMEYRYDELWMAAYWLLVLVLFLTKDYVFWRRFLLANGGKPENAGFFVGVGYLVFPWAQWVFQRVYGVYMVIRFLYRAYLNVGDSAGMTVHQFVRQHIDSLRSEVSIPRMIAIYAEAKDLLFAALDSFQAQCEIGKQSVAPDLDFADSENGPGRRKKTEDEKEEDNFADTEFSGDESQEKSESGNSETDNSDLSDTDAKDKPEDDRREPPKYEQPPRTEGDSLLDCSSESEGDDKTEPVRTETNASIETVEPTSSHKLNRKKNKKKGYVAEDPNEGVIETPVVPTKPEETDEKPTKIEPVLKVSLPSATPTMANIAATPIGNDGNGSSRPPLTKGGIGSQMPSARETVSYKDRVGNRKDYGLTNVGRRLVLTHTRKPYFERQVADHCAQHAVNNALRERVLTHDRLLRASNEIDRNETGDFSYESMLIALYNVDMTLVQVRDIWREQHYEPSYIIATGGHYVGAFREGNKIYFLDSTCESLSGKHEMQEGDFPGCMMFKITQAGDKPNYDVMRIQDIANSPSWTTGDRWISEKVNSKPKEKMTEVKQLIYDSIQDHGMSEWECVINWKKTSKKFISASEVGPIGDWLSTPDKVKPAHEQCGQIHWSQIKTLEKHHRCDDGSYSATYCRDGVDKAYGGDSVAHHKCHCCRRVVLRLSGSPRDKVRPCYSCLGFKTPEWYTLKTPANKGSALSRNPNRQ